MEVRYGTLTEIAAPNEMPRRGYGVKVGTLTQVDERSWNAINAEALEVAGEISSGFVRDTAASRVYDWTDFPVTLPIGLLIEISARAKSTGDYDQLMILTAELTDPDGILRATSTNTETVGPEDYIMSYPSEEIVLDKSGTWVLYVVLGAELA